MASALSTLERASSERSQAEANCRGCVPCLFQNCGQLFGSCCKNDVALVAVSFFLNLPFIMLCYYRMPSYYIHDTKISLSCPTASPSSALSQPSCDVISKAQKLQVEAERSWALSQACAYYQHRCPPGELDSESCIRIMGESCSARVLQCSLLNTMQNLEPVMQTHAQGEGDTTLHHTDTCKQIILMHRVDLHTSDLLCMLTNLTISVSLSQQQCVVRGHPQCKTSHSPAPGL